MKKEPYSRIYSIFFVFAAFFFILNSCEKPNDKDEIIDEIIIDNISITNYPRVDGSTSAHPLQAIIACKLLEIDYLWGKSWLDETIRIWPIPDEKPDVAAFIRDSIVHNGTHSAYVNLIMDLADIILVAREPSQDELNLADSMGIELLLKPIALDAFVFIANANNPVNSLSVKQIQDIYMDNITNWNQVGGPNANIKPYSRDVNSGSQELMESMVMKDLQMPFHFNLVLMGMMGPINAISYDKNGLGYTIYYFEQFMAPNDSLKLIKVNNILPNYKTLKSKQYEYTTEVYSVIRTNLSTSSIANQLHQWLQTSKGKKTIEESGYIPN